MIYTVKLVAEEEGGFSVMVPGLPGCYSQGETREEALENVKEEGESAQVQVDLNVA